MLKKIIFSILLVNLLNAVGIRPCQNPFSTIDWSFFFDEFLIGTYGEGGKNPLCVCGANGAQPDIGIKMRITDMIGFAEITPTPFNFPCFAKESTQELKLSKKGNKFANSNNDTGTYLNAHFIPYPIFAMLNLFTNQSCLSISKIEMAFIGEIEPEWYNEFIASFMHPDNLLVSNPIAQIACLSDCVSSTFKKPNEALIWCRGCWHSQRAEDGRIEGKVGIVDAAELSVNMLDFMAMSFRSLQSIPIMNKPAGGNNPIGSTTALACGKRIYFPRIIKPAFFFQPAFPVVSHSVPIGYPPLLWSNFKTIPGYGSTVFAIWKRKICCFGALHLLHLESGQ